ncbi:MAG: hypothetical protein RL095_3798 [Verrucomicrobiota bacterium]|jgi:hypothetical protein
MTSAKRNGQFLPATENFGDEDPELLEGLALEGLEAGEAEPGHQEPSSAFRLQGDLMRLLRSDDGKSEVPLLWLIGERLRRDLAAAGDAAQASKILAVVAAGLAKFSPVWDEERLLFALGLAEDFPDFDHVSRLSDKLGSAHFQLLLKIHDDQTRCLYGELAVLEGWDESRLEAEIASGERLRQSGLSQEGL